ncbi:gamma-glutamyl phosphate reductase [Methanohalobium evestigatum Z-7303]|uniref:Gamma-glutamyl phosphate reductase n=1 Tax=Methanohalobium evestigatum (strain ATCC BAA-1072 / DSM 3721 / NBRC 107634 / OCM 161 / Z-7303) TaxID=644295 RepID=D7E8T8_METEZ|nr:glutamate-5-semialdehyde dehydrogenase [Methanohalobium evestigatum]ADI73759.1 gamma-glutamyl phosphate reductase [Methanohalobium evestigatum Z-7303]
MVSEIENKVRSAKKSSVKLASIDTDTKNRALEAMAEALDIHRSFIIQENSKDQEDAKKLMEEGKLSKALVERLKVDNNKIDGMIEGIKDVIQLNDPVGDTLNSIELDEGLELYQVSCPIGVIGVIFESRPDVVPQVMSLCLKSGNATIFKGGSEASHSNRAIFDVLTDAIKHTETVPEDAFQLMETREEVMDVLKQDQYIDLLIPRGSNTFVKFIQDNTRIPVLGHSDGICHAFVDSKANLDTAYDVCYDSKVQYPAVCNAIETLLVHTDIADDFLPYMADMYNKAGVKLCCDEESYEILENLDTINEIYRATEEDWRTEYNDLILSIKVVDSIDNAVDHINNYGSHHTDVIITNDKDNKKLFSSLVDSSSVMIDASTRFADGFRYGKGAEVGISTNKIHARGPVGMEGLVIYKYILIGNGQKVDDYTGQNARKFTHNNLDKRYRDVL